MLGKKAVFQANDISHNPVHRLPKAGESPMKDHEVTFGNDQAGLVAQCFR